MNNELEPMQQEEKIMQVNCDASMYNIINMTAETLECTQEIAVTKLAEIGIVNILNYPTGNPLLDAIMEKNNFPKLITKIKAIWNV